MPKNNLKATRVRAGRIRAKMQSWVRLTENPPERHELNQNWKEGRCCVFCEKGVYLEKKSAEM